MGKRAYGAKILVTIPKVPKVGMPHAQVLKYGRLGAFWLDLLTMGVLPYYI